MTARLARISNQLCQSTCLLNKTKSEPRSVIIIGSGAFGLSTALRLQTEGFSVTVIDALEDESDARSNSRDNSRMVRTCYGGDAIYTPLARRSILSWQEQQQRYDPLEEKKVPLYHSDGVLFVGHGDSLATERASYETALKDPFEKDHVEWLGSQQELNNKAPQLGFCANEQGFWMDLAGHVNSELALQHVAERLREAGGQVRFRCVVRRLLFHDANAMDKVVGVQLENGERLYCDELIVCAGAWTGDLLKHWRVPDIPKLTPVPQMLVYVRPPSHKSQQEIEALRNMPCFADDVHCGGYYAFPLLPLTLGDGRTVEAVKFAQHADGLSHHPSELLYDSRLRLSYGEHEADRLLRRMRHRVPSVFEDPSNHGKCARQLVRTKVCYYCDTEDGNFLVDRHPSVGGLSVATGGSGHAFKFVPVLGTVVAACLDLVPLPNGKDDKPEWPSLELMRERFSWTRDRATAEGARR
ncbi:MAG: hypothetical protein MHM6MM_003393 [Cercozoa sp. M6MM]